MVKFEDMGLFQTGGTPTRNRPDYFEGTKPWITTPALGPTYVDSSNANAFLSEEAIKCSATKIIPENSLMIGIRVGVGKVSINTVPMCTNQDIVSISNIDTSKVSLEYLHKYVITQQNYINSQKRGATIQGIKTEMLKEMLIPLPPLETQQKIADVLDRAGALVEKRKVQIEKLDLLIKSQFIEMFGDPVTNPREWNVVSLSDIAQYYNGLTYTPDEVSDKGITVLRSSNIQNGSLDFADVIKVDRIIKDRFFVVENDILMCSRNGSSKLVGKVALIPRLNEKMAFGAFMMIIRSKYYSYLTTFFQTQAFRCQIVTGATTTINQITGNMLNQIRLQLPDQEEIDQFADFVNQVEAQKSLLQQSLEKLERNYKSLMQKCFRGEIF
jgi:Restriction endonuclease S subunits